MTHVNGFQVTPDLGARPIVSVTPSNNVLFACQAAIGKPPPSVKWYIGDKEVVHSNRISIRGDGSLLIVNTMETDTDTYHCEATNVAGKDQSYVALQVESQYFRWFYYMYGLTSCFPQCQLKHTYFFRNLVHILAAYKVPFYR